MTSHWRALAASPRSGSSFIPSPSSGEFANHRSLAGGRCLGYGAGRDRRANDDLMRTELLPFTSRDRILGQVSADDGGPNRIGRKLWVPDAGVRPELETTADQNRERDFAEPVLNLSGRQEVERRQSNGCLSGLDAGPPYRR